MEGLEILPPISQDMGRRAVYEPEIEHVVLLVVLQSGKVQKRSRIT